MNRGTELIPNLNDDFSVDKGHFKPFWNLKMLMVPLWFIYVSSVFLNCLTVLEAPVPCEEVRIAWRTTPT